MRIKSNIGLWLLPRLPFMLMSLAFALQCEEPSDIEPDNLITNPSFEIDGQPNIDGWNTLFNKDHFIDWGFWEDTPPGGGQWSVQILPGGRSQYEGFVEMMLSGINDQGVFELSAWTKTDTESWSHPISLTPSTIILNHIRNGKVIHSKSLSNAPNDWTRISFIDTLTINPSDTLHIRLYAGVTEVSLPIIIFDLVSFMKIK